MANTLRDIIEDEIKTNASTKDLDENKKSSLTDCICYEIEKFFDHQLN